MLLKIEPWYENISHIIFDLEGICYKAIELDYKTAGLKEISEKVARSTITECLEYANSGFQREKCPDIIKFV